ncbi:MAG TPA: hypothetical protein VLT82_08170 [Myxococcaceae bacterium]|nr:hypothetical protein [Myxococcaceae bacterium]
MDESAPAPDSVLDVWTVGAIAVVAYALSNVVHEGLGHGGACLLVGGHPETLNAVFFECSVEGLPSSARRWLAAGGSVANLGVAALAYGALRTLPGGWGRARDFAWLMLAVNVLTPFGYLLFSGLGGIGDWAVVVSGMQPAVAWRLGLAALGAVLYFWWAPRVLMPPLEPFVATGAEERARRTRTLTLVPYLVGGVTFVVAGLRNPHGVVLVLISAAAASFGGTSLLAWYPGLWARRAPALPVQPPLGVPRSVAWLVLGGMVLAIFVGVLGPGVALGPAR